MNIEQEFDDLKKVIEDAGKHAREYFESNVSPNTQKEDGSVVTEIDKKIEQIIRTHIEERFPEDTIVGEEDDTKEGGSGFVWYIDPIDGTDNFVRKIPFFAVTACRLGPVPEDSFSIVHNPASGQTYASLMEDGVYENEHVCNLSVDPVAGRKMINVTSGKSELWMPEARFNLYLPLRKKFGKSGHNNCALLDFAYVAAGRIDGFLVIALSPWDTAAGLYLVKAAGGIISIFENGIWKQYEGAIKDLYGSSYDKRLIVFASHPDIHNQVLEFIGDPKQWADKE